MTTRTSLFKLAMQGEAIRNQEVELLQTDGMVAIQKLRGTTVGHPPKDNG
jgi:hypothetical protein